MKKLLLFLCLIPLFVFGQSKYYLSAPYIQGHASDTTNGLMMENSGTGYVGLYLISQTDTVKFHEHPSGYTVLDLPAYLSITDNVGIGTTDVSGKLIVMDGNVGIGTTNPGALLQISHNAGSSAIFQKSASGATEAPAFIMQKSRGSLVTPTTVVTNDYLGSLQGKGYSGTAWRTGAKMEFLASDVDTDTVAGDILFSTRNTSNTMSQRMIINHFGNIGLSSASPQAKLDVNGNIHGDTLRIDSIWEMTTDHGVKIEGVKFCDSIVNSLRAIQFTTGYTNLPHEEAKIWWDDDNKTLTLDMEGGTGVRLQVGQEEHLRVVNTYGSTVYNGYVSNLTGTQGQRPTIGLALGDTITNAYVLGIITHDIANSSNGYVTTSGLVHDIPMDGTAESEVWNNADLLYLSGTTAGRKTKYQPDAPATSFVLGAVLNNHATEGVMGVRLIVIPRLAHLSDVNARSNQVHHNLLRWDTTYHYWDTVSFAQLAGDYQLYSDTNSIDATRYWVGQQGFITSNLTEEQVQDYAWNVLGGTQTLITVTYQDGTNDVDFVVDNDLSHYSNATSGFLTGNETINLTGDVTGSHATDIVCTVIDDSHNHIISNIDNLQDSLTQHRTDWNSDIHDSLVANSQGFLTTETDPVFIAHPAHGITSFNITAWNTAYGWGDHAGLYAPIADSSKWILSGNNIYSANSGNVGIGSIIPAQKLDVVGIIQTTGLIITGLANSSELTALVIDGTTVKANPLGNDFATISDSSKWILNGADIYSANVDNVGIGSTVPAQELDVNGTIQMTGFKLTTSPTNNHVLTSDASGVGTWQAASGGNVSNTGTPADNQVAIFTDPTTIEGSNDFTFTGTNVGIGTTVPADVLSVSSSVSNRLLGLLCTKPSGPSVSAGIFATSDDGAAMASGDRNAFYTMSGAYDASHNVHNGVIFSSFATENWSATNRGADFRIETTPTGTASRVVSIGIRDNKVGIGITNAVNKLDVEGAAVIGATYSGTNTAPTNGLLVEGNVGIGTTTTSDKLYVYGTFKVSGNTTMNGTLSVTGASITADGFIYSKSYLKSDTYVFGKTIKAIDSDGLALHEDGGAGIHIEDGGEVGIGTTQPTGTLDIRGSINFEETNLTATTLSLTDKHCVIHFTGSSASVLTLPDETPCAGRWYLFCNDGSATMTIKDNDGSTVIKTVTAGNSGCVISLGSKWWAWY